MCLISTRPSRRDIDDPPRHSSHYSAHPPPGTIRVPVSRLPRGSTHSYRESREIVRDDYRRSDPRVIEYRRPSREIEYYEPRSSRRSVSRVREVDIRNSRGSVYDERDVRRSSVRY